MIDTALRETILRHQEQDEKLRPEVLEWAAACEGGSWWLELPGEMVEMIHDDTAADLIKMAYLNRLSELGNLWEVLNDNHDGFTDDSPLLDAAVAVYEAVKGKQDA